MLPTKTHGPMPVPADYVTVTVTLNGTDTNPYLLLGLSRNPFPASGIAEYAYLDNIVSELAVTLLPNLATLVKWLEARGATKDFIAVCSEEYRVGKLVSFDIHFPRGT